MLQLRSCRARTHHRGRLGGARRHRPRRPAARSATRSRRRSRRSTAGALRVAERQAGRDLGGEPVGQEGGAARFRLQDMAPQSGGPQRGGWWDKVDSKFHGWTEPIRAPPASARCPAVVRRRAYIAPGVVLMPCFVNIGAYVGEGTMVDTWATVGSCAQIGKQRATSPAAPASAACSSRCRPTRRSSRTTASSAPARKWSRASSSARARCSPWASSSAQSTKIVDRATGEILYGEVPPYSVVVPGSRPASRCRTAIRARASTAR